MDKIYFTKIQDPKNFDDDKIIRQITVSVEDWIKRMPINEEFRKVRLGDCVMLNSKSTGEWFIFSEEIPDETKD